MVMASADSEAVALGARGIAESAQPGTIVVDMATISPVATRDIAARLEARGIEHLDAPVSGGTAGAEAATLAIMAGGKESCSRGEAASRASREDDPPHGWPRRGAGDQALQPGSQVVNVQGSRKRYLAARRVDPARVHEALLGGFAASKMLEVLGKRMTDRAFAAGIGAPAPQVSGLIVELATARDRLCRHRAHRAAIAALSDTAGAATTLPVCYGCSRRSAGMAGAERRPAWQIIGWLCLAHVASMTVFSAYPALLPQLQAEWSMSNTEAGFVSGLQSAARMG
jgi:hypothetical protein